MYDLIIRDATIVSSAGRVVADVAVKGGTIAYVGPRPPRPAKRELSAIGRFLMPGVIDTGARAPASGADWMAESAAAVTGGVTSVVTLPSLDGAAPNVANSWCHLGRWAALGTGSFDEARDAITAGVALGGFVTLDAEGEAPNDARLRQLAELPGTLGVDVAGAADVPATFEPLLALSRLRGAALHWVHLSRTEHLELLDPARAALAITAGVSPHHLFLSAEEDAVRTQPPLADEKDRRTLWTAVRRNRIDCLASTHVAAGPDAVGAPCLELLLPLMLSAVRHGRLNLEQLVGLCAEGPARVLGLPNKGRIAKGADADLVLFSEGEAARIEPDALLSKAGWSPYLGREASPKPELVMVGGHVTAVRGRIVADDPAGQPLSAIH